MNRNAIIKAAVLTVRAFMVLVVFLAITLIIQTIVQETASMHLMRNRSSVSLLKEMTAEQRDDAIRQSTKKCLADGSIHLVRSLYSVGKMAGSQNQMEIYDTDLNLLWSGIEDDMPYDYLSWADSPEWLSVHFYIQWQQFTPEFSRSLVVPVVSSDKRKVENWRYVLSKSKEKLVGYFTGYDARGEVIGYFGSNGFVDNEDEVESMGLFASITAWTPRDSYSPKVIWQGDGVVYQIDFEKREVEVIYEAEAILNRIGLYSWRKLNAKDGSVKGAMLIRETEGYRLVIDEPREVIEIDVPENYSKINCNVNVLCDKDDFYVYMSGTTGMPSSSDLDVFIKWIEENRDKPKNRWVEIYRLDHSGDMKLLNRYEWVTPGRENVINQPWMRVQEFKKVTSSPSPIAFKLFGRCFFKDARGPRSSRGSIGNVIYEIFRYHSPVSWIGCMLLSLLAVCVAIYHGWCRRRSVLGFVGWLVFVGLFNAAGLFTYLAMNHRPVIRCAVCGKKRHLMGDGCVRCGGGLEVPEKKETDLVLTG